MIKISLFTSRLVIIKDNIELKFPTNKTRLLFAYLLLNRDKRCYRDEIAYSFWEDCNEKRARKNLSTSIWQINKLFDENKIGIEIISDYNYLNLEIPKDILVDIDLYLLLINKSKDEENLYKKLEYLKQASEIGDLQILSAEDANWLYSEQLYYNKLYKDIILDIINIYVSLGEYQNAIKSCNNILNKEPFNDIFSYKLIQIYYLSGRKIAALKFYEKYYDNIINEIGLEPDHKYQEIIKIIKNCEESILDEPAFKTNLIELFTQEIPLIGRDNELNIFKKSLTHSIKNRNLSLFLISGISGIGKTRFIEEINFISKFYKVKSIKLDCNKIKNPPAFELASVLIKKLIDLFDPEELAQIPLHYKNALAYITPSLKENKFFSITNEFSAEEQFKFSFILIFNAIYYLFTILLKESPLLITVDNIQWSDKYSLDLLSYLINNLKNERLIFVNTTRIENVYQNLNDYISSIKEIAVDINLSEIVLHPLTEVEIVKLINIFFDLENNKLNISKESLASILLKESGGIPLIIIEILRLWEQDNLIYYNDEEASWILEKEITNKYKNLFEIDIETNFSERLNSIYNNRLSQLSELLLQIIDIAAVLGFNFEKDIIYDLVKKNKMKIITAFDKLVYYNVFLENDDPAKMRFSHIKLREYVYKNISPLKRKYYHQEIYSYYKNKINPDKLKIELVGLLAFHAYKGEMWESAIKYSLLSGKILLEQGNVPQAIFYLNRALLTYNKNKFSDKLILLDIYLTRGKCDFYLGEGLKAKEDLAISLKLAKAIDNKQIEGEIYSLLSQLNTRIGNYDLALNYIQKVIDMDKSIKEINIILNSLFTMSHISLMTNNLNLRNIVRSKLENIVNKIPFNKSEYNLGKVYLVLGQHYVLLFDNYQEALKLFEKSEIIFRHIKKNEELALTLIYQGCSDFYYGLSHTWEKKYEEGLKLCQKNIFNKHMLSAIIGPIIATYLLKGDYGIAIDLFKDYPFQEEYPLWQIPYLAVKGEVYFWLGDIENSQKLIEETLKYCKEVKIVDYENHARATLGLIKGLYYDFDEGMRLLNNAEKEAEKIPFSLRLSRVLLKKMLLTFKSNNLEIITEEVDKFLKFVTEAQMKSIEGWGYYGQALIEIMKGNFKNARDKITRAKTLADDNLINALLWRVENIFAILSLFELNLQNAIKHYERAANIIINIASKIPDQDLKEKFLSQEEISQVIIRSQINFTDIIDNKIIGSLSDDGQTTLDEYITDLEKRLIFMLENKINRTKLRQFQVAIILLESKSQKMSINIDHLASLFDVHPRTIARDLKGLKF